MVLATLPRRNTDLSRKRPDLIAFRVAHFPKASKKTFVSLALLSGITSHTQKTYPTMERFQKNIK
jgi:hypothetical protein